jgi:hypothetical protein
MKQNQNKLAPKNEGNVYVTMFSTEKSVKSTIIPIFVG